VGALRSHTIDNESGKYSRNERDDKAVESEHE